MSVLEHLFYEGTWECIYRNTDDPTKWYKLDVSRRYWCADPFVVSFQGKRYVFCELLDRKISRGLIGYGVLNEKGNTKINTLMDLGCHTSYPDVFKYRDEWYMIPETVDRRSIELYHAIDFPGKWEKVSTLISGINAVDSTVFLLNGIHHIFIYEENNNSNTLSFAKIDMRKFQIYDRKYLVAYTEKIGRPAGNILFDGGKMIRPIQYGVEHYGGAMQMMEFTIDEKTEVYNERKIRDIRVEDILPSGISKHYSGIHTINKCGNIEIIDIFRKRFFIDRPLMLFMKALRLGGYRRYVRTK